MLSKLIKENLIIPDLKSKGKEDVIREMGALFAESGVVNNLEDFIAAIKARESIESTAIGENIAIPHGRSDAVKELAIGFARSKDGVEFDALDGKPVHLIFMIAAPKGAGKAYLQAVAKIARFLKIKELKQKLLKAETKEDILNVIKEFDARFPAKVEVQMKEGRVVYRH